MPHGRNDALTIFFKVGVHGCFARVNFASGFFERSDTQACVSVAGLYIDYVAQNNGNSIRHGTGRLRPPSRLEQVHYNINSPAVEKKAHSLIKIHYEAYLANLSRYRRQGISRAILRDPVVQFVIYFTTGLHTGLKCVGHYAGRFDSLFCLR